MHGGGFGLEAAAFRRRISSANVESGRRPVYLYGSARAGSSAPRHQRKIAMTTPNSRLRA